MSLSGNFKYVLIPCDTTKDIEICVGNKSGGLSDDFLVKAAKEYFQNQSGGSQADALAAIDSYSPEQRKELAQSFRQQMMSMAPDSNEALSKMPDDAVLQYLKATQSATTCEIMALTVPTKENDYRAVSMYSASASHDQPVNIRATSLLTACGHNAPTSDNNGPAGVRGDVFLGRCKDKEDTDEWVREDFLVEDASPDAPWIKQARTKGGGGGSGASSGGAAPSLSGIMSQSFQQQQQQHPSLQNCTWSQTDEDVELKFAVASGTKSKHIKVNFAPNHLTVKLTGQTLINGKTGGAVSVDDSTYTIQDDGKKGRELCVTLGKKVPGSTWPCAVQP